MLSIVSGSWTKLAFIGTHLSRSRIISKHQIEKLFKLYEFIGDLFIGRELKINTGILVKTFQ